MSVPEFLTYALDVFKVVAPQICVILEGTDYNMYPRCSNMPYTYWGPATTVDFIDDVDAMQA